MSRRRHRRRLRIRSAHLAISRRWRASCETSQAGERACRVRARARSDAARESLDKADISQRVAPLPRAYTAAGAAQSGAHQPSNYSYARRMGNACCAEPKPDIRRSGAWRLQPGPARGVAIRERRATLTLDALRRRAPDIRRRHRSTLDRWVLRRVFNGCTAGSGARRLGPSSTGCTRSWATRRRSTRRRWPRPSTPSRRASRGQRSAAGVRAELHEVRSRGAARARP